MQRLVAPYGFACAVALVAASFGCSSPAATSPRGAVDAYTAALERGQTREAYDLLSAEARREISFQDFEKLLAENPNEVRALVERLRRPTSPALVTAEVTAENGETLRLVYEDGAWRIDESAIDPYGQKEPRQALRAFVRAFDAKRWDVLLRFVPDADREGMTAEILKTAWEGEQKQEMTQVVEGLRRALPQGKLELLGERATMSYGTAGVVELVLERGAWKIEDFK